VIDFVRAFMDKCYHMAQRLSTASRNGEYGISTRKRIAVTPL
jgi:hypothetical protein